MRVLVDLDSTLVDILTPILGLLNKKYDMDVTLDDITNWSSLTQVFPPEEVMNLLEWDYFYPKYVKPIQGSLEFIHTLKEMADVVIVTAGSELPQKTSYIQHLFDTELLYQKEKWRAKGDVLIDDYFLNVYEWCNKTGKNGIIFSNNNTYHYNDVIWDCSKYKRLHTYEDIIKEVRCLQS